MSRYHLIDPVGSVAISGLYLIVKLSWTILLHAGRFHQQIPSKIVSWPSKGHLSPADPAAQKNMLNLGLLTYIKV